MGEITDHFISLFYSTKIQQRLSAGLFLKELQSQMNLIENGKKFDAIRIYSTHDVVMAGILKSLGSYNELQPPYGSTIIFEFWSKQKQKKDYVQLYYLNETTTEIPYLLHVGGCGNDEFCSFENFKNNIEKLIPHDLENECSQRVL
ncbi:EH domain-containing protein 3-like protein [Leptotrombidium deliense]|uniref:acid phosphatase n=1 Tax=Leptotrombidium deliense TaxID=299467 RepID=A0A443S154_9ACAR|nr:EH domain-containing protein 3-like protein [Leptotrombidium deliense]